jgi:hypothetical protein
MIPSLPRAVLLSSLASLALALAGPASGATLTLSNASSDPTVSADRLDGRLELDVTGGSRTQRLTLTLTNATAAPDAFSIDRILFSASNAVQSLALDRVSTSRGGGNITSAWSLVASTGAGGRTDAGKLGIFDWALVTTGAGAAPGEVLTVRIDVTGSIRLTAEDFVQLSVLDGPGEISALGAGRFTAGGKSTYGGAHAPEPGTLVLLLCGLCGLAVVRQRSRRPALARTFDTTVRRSPRR